MPATKIFLDTEFTGLHRDTTLISLALVAETGEELYAEFRDFDRDQITEWVNEEVIKKLEGNLPAINETTFKRDSINVAGNRIEIAGLLNSWFTRFEAVEIWADVPVYDWMLFCDLFGGAMHIPTTIFFAPFDLATLFRIKGMIEPLGKYEKDVSRFDFVGADKSRQHHALEDARVERLCFEKIYQIEAQ